MKLLLGSVTGVVNIVVVDVVGVCIAVGLVLSVSWVVMWLLVGFLDNVVVGGIVCF